MSCLVLARGGIAAFSMSNRQRKKGRELKYHAVDQ